MAEAREGDGPRHLGVHAPRAERDARVPDAAVDPAQPPALGRVLAAELPHPLGVQLVAAAPEPHSALQDAQHPRIPHAIHGHGGQQPRNFQLSAEPVALVADQPIRDQPQGELDAIGRGGQVKVQMESRGPNTTRTY